VTIRKGEGEDGDNLAAAQGDGDGGADGAEGGAADG